MGAIDAPLCVASNGNTLYGVVTANSNKVDETVILVRSNTAPRSLEALSWTAIASTLQKSLTTVPRIFLSPKQLVCHVDNQGVFTLLATDSIYNPNTAIQPSGYQYNPATKAWTNITVSAGYKWTDTAGGALFTMDGSSSTLMHIYKSGPLTLDSSNITVYSPSTHTMTEGSTPWVSRGLVGQYAGGTDSAKTTYRWFTYDGTALSATSPVVTTLFDFDYVSGFFPLGPAGSPPIWAYLHDSFRFYGVTLTGLQAGQEQKASYQFNISGTIPNPGSVTRPDIPGVGDGPKTDSGPTGGNGGERSNLSTGALVGIIGGVVVVLGVAMFALWRRKTSSKPARLEQQPHKELPHLPIAVPVEQYQKEDPYPQKEDPYPEPTPPGAAEFMQTNHQTSPTTSLPQTPSPGNPPSLSPQSFTNSTLANSDMATIPGSPHHNAANQPSPSPQQYPQLQNPAALPIDQ
ncbi:hypothetical protein BGZ74_002766 [Mortierella antarctica]|nr:hypothetical protein BGZ74_002766 [Mortierella antarctica]